MGIGHEPESKGEPSATAGRTHRREIQKDEEKPKVYESSRSPTRPAGKEKHALGGFQSIDTPTEKK